MFIIYVFIKFVNVCIMYKNVLVRKKEFYVFVVFDVGIVGNVWMLKYIFIVIFLLFLNWYIFGYSEEYRYI